MERKPVRVWTRCLPLLAASALLWHPGDEDGALRGSSRTAPRQPNPWFFLERAYPLGFIPRDVWHEAQIQAEALRQLEGARSGGWTSRGPTNIGGRITDIAVDPENDATVFVSAAEGGVLRTTDSGQHWTPLFDDQATLSVGAVTIDPSNPSTVYAGTGEVNPGGGSVAYGGSGVYRSTDHGETWRGIGLEASGSIGRIRIDPTNPSRIWVAVMGDLWSKGPDRGVYRSTDAGGSWARVLFVSDSTGCVDLIERPDQPNVLYAAMWERIRRPDHYQYGGVTSGVYHTTDGGDTWSLAAGGLPAPGATGGRIGLSLCAAQPQYMHAIYADRTGWFAGIYRSTNGGASWSRANDGALASIFSSYGWWFGNIRTHPTDPGRIFALGLDFYRSTNGGASWAFAGGGMHVDHHALDFGSGAAPVLYCGNDGGVDRSTNGGTAWTKLPDLPITQAYRIALDAQNPAALYAGAQDNGTVRTQSGGLADWSTIYGGDGFQPLVRPTNSNHIWAQYQYGALAYSSDGGFSFVDATNGISGSDRHNWNTPVIIDPTNPNRLYYGTQRVYRSTNSTSWSIVSPDLTGGPGGGQSGQVMGTLTTIAVSPLDAAVLWAGADDGHVAVSTNGGASWSDVSALLPDRWITSVSTDPAHRETAFITISGFRWGSPLPHVYRTLDLGGTWESISGNLPEAPCNDLEVDPLDATRLFVATDVGVFESRDSGGSWLPLGSNLPNVVVTSLLLSSSRELVAATYGRGVFSYPIDQPSSVIASGGPPPPGILLPPFPNPARDGAWIRWRLDRPARLEIELFAVSGRRLDIVDLGTRPAGSGQVWWTFPNPGGGRIAAGSYAVRMLAEGRESGRQTVTLLR